MPNGAGRLFQGSVTSTRLREKTMVLYGDFVYPGDLRIVHSTVDPIYHSREQYRSLWGLRAHALG